MYKQLIVYFLILPMFVGAVAVTAMGAEGVGLPDPTSSLHPSDNIVNLAKLRPLIQQEPDNMDLLGRVLMTYVNLCLEGEAENEGSCGPWLEYAQGIFTKRERLRKQQPALRLQDEMPDLWYLAIAGYMADAHQRLIRYEAEKMSEDYRTLLALTMYDYRPLHVQLPKSLHGKYALMRAEHLTGKRQEYSRLFTPLERRHHPAMVTYMYRNMGHSSDYNVIIGEGIAMAVWILASQDINDDVAIPALLSIAKALQVPVDATLERKALWRATYRAAQAISDHDKVPVEAIGVATAMLESLSRTSKKSAVIDNPNLLYDFHDLTLFVRDINYNAAFYGFYPLRYWNKGSFAHAEKEYYEVLKRVAPDSYITARYGLGAQDLATRGGDKVPPERWDHFATVVERLVDESHGASHGIVAIALSKLGVGRMSKAIALLLKHLSFRRDIPRAEIERLCSLVDKNNSSFDIIAGLEPWSQRSPGDQNLLKLRNKLSPDSSLFLTRPEVPPLSEWGDIEINQTASPTKYPVGQKSLAVCWTGYVRIEKAGQYIFAIESINSSRLVIGDRVVNILGTRPKQLRQVGSFYAAGEYPLRLEYNYYTDENFCRFLYKTAGTNEWIVVPEAMLSHGVTRNPGLVGQAWKIPSRILEVSCSTEQLELTRQRPYHFNLHYTIGDNLFDNWNHREALPFLRTCFDQNKSSSSGRRLSQCYLYQDTPDIDAALVVLAQGADLWDDSWQLGYTMKTMREKGRMTDLYQASVKSESSDELWPYVEGYYHFDQGRLAAAARSFANIVGPGKTGGRRLTDYYYHGLVMDFAILSRMIGPEPDWTRIAEAMEKKKSLDAYQLSLDFLQGSLSEDEAIAAIPADKKEEKIYYFAGLVALTQGRFDHAKQRFSEFAAHCPDHLQTGSAKQLTRWIEANAISAKVDDFKAPPLPKGMKKAKPVAPGANDF